MKKLILPFLLLISITTYSQQKAALKKVTVYPRGAVLEHNAKLNLKKGTQTVVLRGLATNIDVGSLLIEVDGYVNVLSHKYLPIYKPTVQKPDAISEVKITHLQKKIARLNKQIKIVQEQIAFEKKSMDIVTANPKTVGETAMNVNALSSYVDLYKDQAYKSQSKIILLNEKQEYYSDSINIYNEKIDKLENDKLAKAEIDSLKNTGCLELQLNAQQDVLSQLKFSYFSNQASWNASYDIMGENIDQALKVRYKANIFQSSGLDWNNIKVSVSTSQPNRSNNQPMLSAWYLDVYKGFTKNNEGLYNSEGATNFIPSFGENNVPFEINMFEQSGINISFDAEMTYTIPSDNNQYIVTLKTLSVPCIYKYYTVPKLDKDVFLLAEIQDFEQYNFLPGEAQVFLEGKFTGKTLLDPFVTADNINLSLGRDNNVLVKRERSKKVEKTKFLDGNKIDQFKYTILVKNNRAKDINIIIKDQFPISNNEKIIITDKDHSSDGNINDTNGVVTWIEKIGSTKSETVSISYTISRPKNMVIPGL